jgi:hypothetical protein
VSRSRRRTFCGSFLDLHGQLGARHVGVLGKPADEAKSGLDDLSGLGIVPGAKQNCLEEAASTNAALAPAGWARAAGGGMGETRGHTAEVLSMVDNGGRDDKKTGPVGREWDEEEAKRRPIQIAEGDAPSTTRALVSLGYK